MTFSFNIETLRTASILIAMFWLSGCTTLNVMAPFPEVESPEVVGRSWRPRVTIAGLPGPEIALVKNAQTRPPDMTTAYTDDDGGDLFVGGELGLGTMFQVGLKGGLFRQPGILTAKFQILGSGGGGEGEGGSEGSPLLLAVFGRVGTSSDSEGGEQDRALGPGGYPWRAAGRLSFGGFGASLGYRVAPKVMLYTGYSENRYTAKAEVSQEPSSQGDSAGGVYVMESLTGKAQAVALGLKFGKKVSVSVQGAYTEMEWNRLPKKDEFAFAFELGAEL